MRRLGRPSPALVVALVALFFALGGTGYAVSRLPKNSVTSAQVKDYSLLSRDFRKGQLPHGPQGPQGVPGPEREGQGLLASIQILQEGQATAWAESTEGRAGPRESARHHGRGRSHGRQGCDRRPLDARERPGPVWEDAPRRVRSGRHRAGRGRHGPGLDLVRLPAHRLPDRPLHPGRNDAAGRVSGHREPAGGAGGAPLPLRDSERKPGLGTVRLQSGQ